MREPPSAPLTPVLSSLILGKCCPGPIFCSQLLHCGMTESENLVPGAVPCSPFALWGQWLNTGRCPPGATCTVLLHLPAQSTGTLAGQQLPSTPTAPHPMLLLVTLFMVLLVMVCITAQESKIELLQRGYKMS